MEAPQPYEVITLRPSLFALYEYNTSYVISDGSAKPLKRNHTASLAHPRHTYNTSYVNSNGSTNPIE